MKPFINKYIFIGTLLCLSINLLAKEEEPKDKKKKDPEVKVKEDVKVDFDNKSKNKTDDTLVFEKTFEDTLIFADDEMRTLDSKTTGQSDKEYKRDKSGMQSAIHSELFPNPCLGSSKIEIDVPQEEVSEIIIISLSGTLVLKENFTGSVYHINNLSSGTYIVQINTQNQVVRKRLFVN